MKSFFPFLAVFLVAAPMVHADDPPIDSFMKDPTTSLGSIKPADPNLQNMSWENAQSRSLMGSMHQLRDNYVQKQQDIDKERQEASSGKITALEVQKDRELDEYRHGLFCSGCNQTRSHILAKGEQFPHSGQHVIAATQEQLDAKALEWDQRIAAAKVEQQQALLRLDKLEGEQKQMVADMGTRVAEWRQALIDEDAARSTAWESQLSGFKLEVTDTQAAIRQDDLRIASEQAGGSKASAELIAAWQADKTQNTKHLANIAARAGRAFAERKVQSDAFTQSLYTGMSEAGGLLSQVGGPMLVPFSVGAAGGFGIAGVSTTSKLPISASIEPGKIGLSGNFGALRASLSVSCDWLRSECKVEATMASSLPVLSSFKAGMQNTTTYGGPNGASTSSSPVLKAGPVNVGELMKGP